MRLFLTIFFLICSCSSIGSDKYKKVYICGDHECKNNREINDYFKNNISIEVYTISSSSKKNKEFDLVELNIPSKEKVNMVSIDTKRKEIRENIKNRKKNEKIKINTGEKNFINKERKNKPVITLVRICKSLDECDINEVAKVIFKEGNNKNYPDLTDK